MSVHVMNIKLVIHGYYVNDEFEVEKSQIEKKVLHLNMFLLCKFKWQNYSNEIYIKIVINGKKGLSQACG